MMMGFMAQANARLLPQQVQALGRVAGQAFATLDKLAARQAEIITALSEVRNPPMNERSCWIALASCTQCQTHIHGKIHMLHGGLHIKVTLQLQAIDPASLFLTIPFTNRQICQCLSELQLCPSASSCSALGDLFQRCSRCATGTSLTLALAACAHKLVSSNK